MFKKFDPSESKQLTLMKNKVARDYRNSVIKQYPILEEIIDDFWPKKSSKQQIMKMEGKVSLIIVDSVPMFYQQRDGPMIPTLRMLHRFPQMLPAQTCDRGAIKFILSGSNIMCPVVGMVHLFDKNF